MNVIPASLLDWDPLCLIMFSTFRPVLPGKCWGSHERFSLYPFSNYISYDKISFANTT